MKKETVVVFKPVDRSQSMGSSFSGYLKLNYNQIVEVFGDSNAGKSEDGKVDWEWVFKLNNEVVTIYNYKTGPSYSPRLKDIKPQDIDDWHIGSHTKEALDLLRIFINGKNQYLNTPDLIIVDH